MNASELVECRNCGGPAPRVRSDRMDSSTVHHYRCRECREGGHRSIDRETGDLNIADGPVFRSSVFAGGPTP